MRGSRAVAGSLAILGLWSCLFAGPQIAGDHLFQHWVRSYEEEQPGQTVQVFRPASSKQCSPSRFRMAYTFARNGSCEWYALSPADAHHFEACTWNVNASDKTILQITEEEATTSFKMVELSRQLLRLEPVE